MTQPPRRLSPEAAAEVDDLFRKVASDLFSHAVVLAQGRRSEAEDAVQEVFLATARNWHTVRQRSDDGQRAYLFTALRRKFIDKWRKESLHPLAVEREDQVREFGRIITGALDRIDVVNDYTVCLDALVRDRLWSLLKLLPRQQYCVAYLSWEWGWATAMIAEALAIEESTVRAHRTFAARRIKESGIDLRSIGIQPGGEEV
jgi:RNA polymerase sigma factor (sigma-70 family)